ncbi:MAG: 16S rRNA (cytosine(1402)-N(4))-methyltransferase RsmH [Armatimonadota bacterium]|nr:MAG: 16S rRNA (cytosine(1402)-N(4))-methyltransferase RsmH [Armatimonadota bacterium]
MEEQAHRPVMVAEVLEYLAIRPGMRVVDCTVGSGGHAQAICEEIGPDGELIGIDADADAIERARARLSGKPAILVQGDFRDISTILDKLDRPVADGMVYDLGLSAEQLRADEGRGFSFRSDAPLDMRRDPRVGKPAAELVAELPEQDLARLLWEFGEERWARRIARAIVRERERAAIRTAAQFAEVVAAAIPSRARSSRIHPATKSMMALRIAANDELAALRQSLPEAIRRTTGGGRIVVLSYHSLEDRVTKNAFRDDARACRCPPFLPTCRCEGRPLVRILTRKPVMPSTAEIQSNPRARSAKLRAAERIPEG